MRLDQYLTSQKISASRSQVTRWIKEGHVKVNDKPAKPSQEVHSKDTIVFHPPSLKPSILVPEDIPLDFLYEDDDLIVINKEAEMVVHPGAGHTEGTLVGALLAHCKGLSGIGGLERPGVVHRLDKGTSGAMVAAKNDAAHLDLSRQFKDRRVKKIYWALVYGKMKNKEGVISKNIVRSSTHRKKFAVSQTKGKAAETHYRVLREGEGLSLIELTPKTGRTHQIRVHLTDAGHSVVGDPTYGGHAKKFKQLKPPLRLLLNQVKHPLLHARLLGFEHPTKKEWMEFEAELPEDFKRVYDSFF